jgi:hypothetical protein
MYLHHYYLVFTSNSYVDDEQKLRQLCSNFVCGRISIEDVKSFDFNDIRGRGKRKRYSVPESSSDEEEPVKTLVLTYFYAVFY